MLCTRTTPSGLLLGLLALAPWISAHPASGIAGRPARADLRAPAQDPDDEGADEQDDADDDELTDDERAARRAARRHVPPSEAWIARALAFLNERYDADGDGRVSAAEYPRPEVYWLRLDRDHNGFIEVADWQLPPPDKAIRWQYRAPAPGAMSPSFRIREVPEATDELTPPTTLALDPKEPRVYSPETLRGEGAIAIMFGNNTAPRFRSAMEEFQRLADQYGEVNFVVVCGPELHAIDGAEPSDGMDDLPLVEEPTSDAERTALAQKLRRDLGLRNMKLLVDNGDQLATMMYRGKHGRCYWMRNGILVGWRSETKGKDMRLWELEDLIREMLHLERIEREPERKRPPQRGAEHGTGRGAEHGKRHPK